MTKLPFRSREDYRHWVQIETRWHDNDAYGHVNNVIYYSWFDTAVNKWLIQASLLDVTTGNPIGLVVESGCQYAASLSFPQTIEVGPALARLGRSSATYSLGIFAVGHETAAAQGHFTHVYVDRDGRRPVSIPEGWRGSLARLGMPPSAAPV